MRSLSTIRDLAARIIRKLRRVLGTENPVGSVELGAGDQLAEIQEKDLAYIRTLFQREKFFVLGYPRSGTTLLARLIRLHPEIHCNWQMQYFSERGPVPVFTAPFFQQWLNHRSNRWVREYDPTAVLLRLQSDYILERGAEEHGKRIVGDKSPNDNGVEALKWLSRLYPDAKIIYILRDGRDAVLSKRIQAFIDQPQWLNREDAKIREALLHEPDGFMAGNRSIFSDQWLSEAASDWAQHVNACVSYGEETYTERFLVLKFEDLLSGARDEMAGVWSFLEGRAPGEKLLEAVDTEMLRNPAADWHESKGYRFLQSIPRGSHGAWKQVFTKADQELFEECAGEALMAWGYRE